MMGHGTGPGGSSGLLSLFAFKLCLQKKMMIKTSIVSPAVVADTHLPCAAKLLSSLSSESIFSLRLRANYRTHLWIRICRLYPGVFETITQESLSGEQQLESGVR